MSEPNATPARKSLLDQIHDAIRREEQDGQRELAEWMRKHADEPCPAAIAQFMEASDVPFAGESFCSTHSETFDASQGEVCPQCALSGPPATPAPRTDAAKEAIGMRERFLAARNSDIASSNLFMKSGAYDAARGALTPEHFSMLGMLVFVNHYATVLPEDEERMSKRARELAEKYGWEDRIAARMEPNHAD